MGTLSEAVPFILLALLILGGVGYAAYHLARRRGAINERR